MTFQSHSIVTNQRGIAKIVVLVATAVLLPILTISLMYNIQATDLIPATPVTPTPTNTPAPIPTSTPTPTATATPAPTLSPTPSPIPTNTPSPTPTAFPTPTPTPVPTTFYYAIIPSSVEKLEPFYLDYLITSATGDPVTIETIIPVNVAFTGDPLCMFGTGCTYTYTFQNGHIGMRQMAYALLAGSYSIPTTFTEPSTGKTETIWASVLVTNPPTPTPTTTPTPTPTPASTPTPTPTASPTPEPTNTPAPTATPIPTPTPTPFFDHIPGIATTSLPRGIKGRPYRTMIQGFDLDRNDTLTMTITNLPPKLKQGKCVTYVYRKKVGIRCFIEGIPTRKGTFTVEVKVQDNHGAGMAGSLPLTIR